MCVHLTGTGVVGAKANVSDATLHPISMLTLMRRADKHKDNYSFLTSGTGARVEMSMRSSPPHTLSHSSPAATQHADSAVLPPHTRTPSHTLTHTPNVGVATAHDSYGSGGGGGEGGGKRHDSGGGLKSRREIENSALARLDQVLFGAPDLGVLNHPP